MLVVAGQPDVAAPVVRKIVSGVESSSTYTGFVGSI